MTTVQDERFWDERYSTTGKVWSGNPNPQLVTEASGMLAGQASRTALDVGCGEGADSIWLATEGWQVTAVDISRVALQRAAEHEDGLKLRGTIEWDHRDLLTWAPPAAAFDLVSAHFMHLPSEHRVRLHTRLATAVSTGGTLLIVGHSASDTLAGARRPTDPDVYFTATDVADSLDSSHWRIDVAESRPRTAQASNGSPMTVHDEILLAVRLA